jgi:hypothetical protein
MFFKSETRGNKELLKQCFVLSQPVNLYYYLIERKEMFAFTDFFDELIIRHKFFSQTVGSLL